MFGSIKEEFRNMCQLYGKGHAVAFFTLSVICILLGSVNLILSFTIEFNLIAIIVLSTLIFFVICDISYLSFLKKHVKIKKE